MDDVEYRNFDRKDLYDPRDPHIRRSWYHMLMRQTMAALVHELWCEWAISMVQQNMIEPNKVEQVLAAIVPFHNLDPESQRHHLIRVEKLCEEFAKWKLMDRALKKGGPAGGGKIGND